MSAVPMRKILALLACTLALGGCASGPQADPRDPLEPYNRAMYKFNDSLDRAVIKPVATAYKDALPYLVRKGVSNFFNNLQDVWSFINCGLQLKGEEAGDNFFRFGVNTLMGLGGLLDVASEMGIERHKEDFGQTLGHWGVGAGPYIVLPLLGPSTLRDSVALSFDAKGNAISRVQDVPTRNSLTVTRLIDQRAGLLQASGIMDQVALDPYLFTREAYLQHRRSAVYDGNPPDESTETPPSAPDK